MHSRPPDAIPPRLLLALPLVVAAVLAAAGLPNAFTLDDVAIIQDNARVHSLANVWQIVTSPYWPPPWREDLYRPLMSLLHAAQFTFGGGAPLLFRLVSLGLYAWSVWLVLRLLQRFASPLGAVLGAALFAAHPVHVEAVAQAVNQGELLTGILACLLVGRYLDARARGVPTTREWMLMCAIIAAACLIKEHGFVFPLLLVATECTLARDARAGCRPVVWRALVPGFIAAFVVVAAILAVRAAVLSGDVSGSFAAEALEGLSLPQRALTMLQVVPQWFRLLLWPSALQVDYGPDEMVASQSFGPSEQLGAALLVGTVAVFAWLRTRRPIIAFALLGVAVSLIPVSNVIIPSGILLAERTLYTASIFAVVVIVDALDTWVGGVDASRRMAVTAIVSVLTVLGLARSVERQQVWRNTYTLWQASLVEAPRSRRLAAARAEASKEVVADYAQRARASSTPWVPHREAAALLHMIGADSLAVDEFRASVALNPDRAAATADLAVLLAEFGRVPDAEVARAEAAQLGASADRLGLADAAITRARGRAGTAAAQPTPPH